MSFTEALEGIIKNGKCPRTHNLLHSTSSSGYDESEENNDAIDSQYVSRIEPVTWTSQGDCEISTASLIDQTATYTIESGMAHVLKGSFLETDVPSAEVIHEYRDTIRIAWCENLGFNTVEKAVFEYGQKIKMELPSIFHDAEHQYNMSRGAGKRKDIDKNIGNVPELTEFSASLPAYRLCVRQRWFYWNRKTFWPLFKYREHLTKHIYTFRPYECLLRIQQYRDGVWVPLTSKDNVAKYVIFGTTKTPSLKGRFGQLSPEELEVNTSPGCVPDETILIRDVVVIKSKVSKKYGTEDSIQLSSRYICPYFYYMASNTLNSLIGEYSNYRNNYDDHPIVSSSGYYGSNPLFKDSTSQNTNMCQGEFFPSVPRVKGYNVYSFVFDPNNEDADSAPILGNGSPETNTELFVKTVGDESQQYYLHVVMVILRPLTTTQNKDGSFSVKFD